MANMLESYGLDFLAENEESMMGTLGYTVQNGRAFTSYHDAPYIYMNMGRVEFWASTIKDKDGKLAVSDFHTHCGGNHIWEMICSDIDLTPKASAETERILMMYKSGVEAGMLPVDIINADILPSFLKGEKLKLQVVAPCWQVHYYATEADYEAAAFTDDNGKKWSVAVGSLFPLKFLYNHSTDRYTPGEEYEDDADICFAATVKAVYYGKFKVEGEEHDTFLRCVADTIFGELEFHHTIEQVPEDMRQNIRAGAIISGTCILSADAAIEEYENGIVKNAENNLQLIRYSIEKGENERLRPVLTEATVYETETSGKSYQGPDAIIAQFNYVHENHDGKYITYSAVITEAIDLESGYPVGTRCIILADEQDNYESIGFVTTNQNGDIEKIKISTDSRYRFQVEKPPHIKTPLDDVEAPKSVADLIIARAKFHGFLDYDVESDQILEKPVSEPHKEYAQQMLDALQDSNPDDKTYVMDNLIGYLFAKSVERTVIERKPDALLQVSYKTDDALIGTLHTVLTSDDHAALERAMKLAKQFGKDIRSFMRIRGMEECDYSDTFLHAAIIVQQIGQLYAENGFNSE